MPESQVSGIPTAAAIDAEGRGNIEGADAVAEKEDGGNSVENTIDVGKAKHDVGSQG